MHWHSGHWHLHWHNGLLLLAVAFWLWLRLRLRGRTPPRRPTPRYGPQALAAMRERNRRARERREDEEA